MAVDVSTFRIDHPQFADPATYSDATIARALERAALRVNSDVWGDLADEGLSLLAAHLMALGAIAQSSSGSNTGGLSQVSIAGQSSVQFSAVPSTKAASNSGYSATRYGIEFKELMDLVTGGSVRIY